MIVCRFTSLGLGYYSCLLLVEEGEWKDAARGRYRQTQTYRVHSTEVHTHDGTTAVHDRDTRPTGARELGTFPFGQHRRGEVGVSVGQHQAPLKRLKQH